jgi:branched-chain amino acid aminotransferase
MTHPPADRVWMDGKLVPWDQATVHVGAHALHYGSSVFEGIRAYRTAGGPAVFCLEPHVERLFRSAKIGRLEIPFTLGEIRQAILETVAANGLEACYIRPIAFRGWGGFGLDGRRCPTHVSILTLEMGNYLGSGALEEGVDVGVSSWRRMAPGTLPAGAKIGGQYVNSQLVVMEAVDRGYAEGIALDVHGWVSEGSGENLFAVVDGGILTPPPASSILRGVTRQCVMTLAGDLGYPVREEWLPREVLYTADELFFSGTAAEIAPIRSVDGIPVGIGRRGPITERLQNEFFGIIEGRLPDRYNWLTPVGADCDQGRQ